MTNPEIDLAQLAATVLDESSAALGARDLPTAVRDAADDYKTAIGDVIDAGRQLSCDVSELNAKADLIPRPGLVRLREEAVSAAQSRARESDRRAEHALEQLRGSLIDAALPRVDPARESLAREELTLALGEATGDQAAARVRAVAQSGSREAAGVLFSGFGATLLHARGLQGRAFDEAIGNARTVAAAVSLELGETQRERLAGRALEGIDRLAAARGAAGGFTAGIARRAA